jgi:hypothetical protein
LSWPGVFASGNEGVVIVVQICLDESGKPKGPCVSFCGWVADTPRWRAFEQEWRVFLREKQIRSVHMAELMGRDDEPYQNMSLTREDRLKIVSEGFELVNKHSLGAIHVAVDCQAFKLMSKESQRKCGNDCHVMCFEQCVRLTIKVLEAIRTKFSFGEGWGQGATFVFDDNPEYAVECYNLVRNAKEQHPLWRKWIGSICFADDEIYTPLQAADMLAWIVRHLVKKPNPSRQTWQYLTANQLWEIMRYGTRHVFKAVAIHSEESLKYLDGLLREGKNLEELLEVRFEEEKQGK